MTAYQRRRAFTAGLLLLVAGGAAEAESCSALSDAYVRLTREDGALVDKFVAQAQTARKDCAALRKIGEARIAKIGQLDVARKKALACHDGKARLQTSDTSEKARKQIALFEKIISNCRESQGN
jgi:hypothetical protein